jgi:hypothetical protein
MLFSTAWRRAGSIGGCPLWFSGVTARSTSTLRSTVPAGGWAEDISSGISEDVGRDEGMKG